MDAFESVVEMLLRREGYWTRTSFKVELTPSEKRRINNPTAPRWEIDVVAYSGGRNEILAVECKSFLDSSGVTFRNGTFDPERRYKLFTDATLRRTVLARLKRQLVDARACGKNPTVTLCLATGRIAATTRNLKEHFARKGWRLFDTDWLCERLRAAADAGYENDVAHVVAKMICRNASRMSAS